jgi:hypothetical protein
MGLPVNILIFSTRNICPVLDFVILRTLSDISLQFPLFHAYDQTFSSTVFYLCLHLKITHHAHQTKKSKLLTSSVFWIVTPRCPTFRINVLPPSSGPKSKPSKQTSMQQASRKSRHRRENLKSHVKIIDLENLASGCFEKKTQGQQFLKPIITKTDISWLCASPSLIVNLTSVSRYLHSDIFQIVYYTWWLSRWNRFRVIFTYSSFREIRVLNGAVSCIFNEFPRHFISRGKQPLLETARLTKGEQTTYSNKNKKQNIALKRSG